jgi:hypothetical protein
MAEEAQVQQYSALERLLFAFSSSFVSNSFKEIIVVFSRFSRVRME